MPRGRRAPRAPRNDSSNANIIDCTIHRNHVTTIRETEDYFKVQKTVKDHCRRLNEMIRWIQGQYPDYYTEAVHPLTEEQLYDKKR